MVRRDPALRQPAGHQQHIRTNRLFCLIVLRALLVPPQRARLRRLREMHPGTDTAKLLDHEPPAVVASNATSSSRPPNRAKNLRTPDGPPALSDYATPHRCRCRATQRSCPPDRPDQGPSRSTCLTPHQTFGFRVEQQTRSNARSVEPHPLHTVGHGPYLLFEWPACAGPPRVPSIVPFDAEDRPPSTPRPRRTCSCHLCGGRFAATIRRRTLVERGRRRLCAAVAPPSRSRPPPETSCHVLGKPASMQGRGAAPWAEY